MQIKSRNICRFKVKKIFITLFLFSVSAQAEIAREVECYVVKPATSFGANLLAVANYKFSTALQFQKFHPAKNIRIGGVLKPATKTYNSNIELLYADPLKKDFQILLGRHYIKHNNKVHALEKALSHTCE